MTLIIAHNHFVTIFILALLKISRKPKLTLLDYIKIYMRRYKQLKIIIYLLQSPMLNIGSLKIKN